MHSMLVAPGGRGGQRGRGNLELGKKNDFRHGLKDCSEGELVFSAGGRLVHRTGAAFYRHGLKDCSEGELVFSAGGRLFHRTGAAFLHS